VAEKLVIGTRGSKLALWQASYAANCLKAQGGAVEVVLKHIITTGDKILDVPLARIGGKGLFTKELEKELLAGEIDLAVHSLKDMPTELPPGLVLAAVTERLEPSTQGSVIALSPGLGHLGPERESRYPFGKTNRDRTGCHRFGGGRSQTSKLG